MADQCHSWALFKKAACDTGMDTSEGFEDAALQCCHG